jgi:hypothetical protein
MFRAEHEYKELPTGKKKTSDLFMNLLEPLHFKIKGVQLQLAICKGDNRGCLVE